ncbi:uncharacterized protein LOC123560301 [Mercenaria mercenaria]|uniref:uncharacterized protein LOC123560301 n=1 Tax=Mercenaria mercenaria TaxID=6596 RepID=UPI00234F9A02|nr:uncharacterized protein LOC123560301 [Mercenaria mercenaria]
MSWAIAIYMVILFLELSVGCSVIIWKCSVGGADLECKVAIGGTITSIAIWLLVILVCPCYVSQCEICNMLDDLIQKCSHYFGKIRATKPHIMYIQNEVYLPTTVSLLENRHEDSVSNSEDTAELIQKVETGSFVLGDKVAINSVLTTIVAKQLEKIQFEPVSDSQDVPLLSGLEQGTSYSQTYYVQHVTDRNIDHSSLMNNLVHEETGD